MKTTVYVVTHGEKHGGANPGMAMVGFAEIRSLRGLIPENPAYVVCGTGRRHVDVSTALEVNPDRYTCLAGDSDSMEVNDGDKYIVLAHGMYINPKEYTSLEDNTPGAKAMITSLPDNSVICGGRPTMIMLGFREMAKSASVYRIVCEDGQILEAVPVVETGTPDPALQ